MSTVQPSAERAAYIAGLRKIADALEADPDLPAPYEGSASVSLIFCDTKEQVQAWARVMTGAKRKEVDDDRHYGFRLVGQINGVRVKVLVKRDEVCRRVVTGTRTEIITEQITRVIGVRRVPVEIEDVEWVCEPLLAELKAGEQS